MNRKQKSLRSIARSLDISAMTLYRVLNNAPGVLPATRRRVTSALDKAGVLQSRKLRHTVLFDIQDDLYKKRLADSLLARISDLEHKILIGNHRKSKYEFLKMAGNADTVIFFSSPAQAILDAVRMENPDIFRINVSGGSGGDIIIGVHNFLGGRMAADHLYRNGHRNVAVVTTPVEPTQLDRHKGFVGEMSVCAPKGKVYPVFFRNSWKRLGKRVLRLIQKKKITAVFASADYPGYQLLLYLLDNGIRIPEDVSLLSYDYPEKATEKRPVALDTIGFDQEQIVRMTQYYLLHRQVKDAYVSCHCLIAPELSVQGSVKNITPTLQNEGSKK